jgi:hexosaminidase
MSIQIFSSATRRFLIACFILLAIKSTHAQVAASGSDVRLVPVPVSLEKRTGKFQISPKTSIVLSSSDKQHKGVADFLAMILNKATGYRLNVTTEKGNQPAIKLALNSKYEAKLGKEGYVLEIDPRQGSMPCRH